MKMNMRLLIAGLALLALALPVQAHHPFAAQFDKDKPVTMAGTVTKVEWTNPHAHIFMDVKDQNGQMTKWDFELGGLNKLRKIGWKKDSAKMGDQLTITGWRARDGSNRANADTVTFANGEKLAAGSSYFEHNKEKRTSD